MRKEKPGTPYGVHLAGGTSCLKSTKTLRETVLSCKKWRIRLVNTRRPYEGALLERKVSTSSASANCQS